MEEKGSSIAKKIWHIFRVAFFMLKKGICKRKILLDLNIMMKRSKIAGKNIHNLMFHHHPGGSDGGGAGADLEYAAKAAADPEEYEFSCSSTPVHRRYNYLFHKKKPSHHQLQPDMEAVSKVLEMMTMSSMPGDDVMASPALPGLGFGRSPAARQLRITDSPYPAQDSPEENSRVDEAAEDFINKFYSQLKQQKYY